jgi:CBS domain-containing protein/nucleotide-binding universal stress UspA family protein
MTTFFKRILSPIDFDENSLRALDVAADLARLSGAGATVFVMHVVASPAARIDTAPAEEQAAQRRIEAICGTRLAGLSYEVLTRTGDPAIGIVRAEEELRADLVVLATNRSRKKPKAFPGSVTERVVRESVCPVMTVRPTPEGDPDSVGSHMTVSPVSTVPDATVAQVEALMRENRIRTVPVLENERIVGIVTDRDLASSDATPDCSTALVMTREVVTVSPRTSVQEAARLLLECEVDGLPVVDSERLVGVITRSDILQAFAGTEARERPRLTENPRGTVRE